MGGTALRHQPEQERSRAGVEAILDATAELLERDGVDRTTITAIAKRAGLSKAAVYRYFPNKATLIRELALRHITESGNFVDTAAADTTTDVRTLIYANFRAYLETYRRQPFRVQLRAAIRADPELAAADLADSRRHARMIADAAAVRGSETTRAELERRALLLLELTDGVVRLVSMVDDDEANQLLDEFCLMATQHLLTGPQPHERGSPDR
jgi:AcrR family transcriptional regulator